MEDTRRQAEWDLVYNGFQNGNSWNTAPSDKNPEGDILFPIPLSGNVTPDPDIFRRQVIFWSIVMRKAEKLMEIEVGNEDEYEGDVVNYYEYLDRSKWNNISHFAMTRLNYLSWQVTGEESLEGIWTSWAFKSIRPIKQSSKKVMREEGLATRISNEIREENNSYMKGTN